MAKPAMQYKKALRLQLIKLAHRAIKLHVLVRWVPLTFCLSFLLSSGPLMQKYALNLLNSESNSIYGSSYQESLARSLPLSSWLGLGLHWQYVIMGCAISAFSVPARQPRQILGRIVFSSFVVLMGADLLFGAWASSLTAGFIFENALSNAVGAVVLAFFAVAVYSLVEFFLRWTAAPLSSQRASFCLLVPLAGIFGSTALHYGSNFFYWPVPVVVDVQLPQSTQGKFLTSTARSIDGNEAAALKPFELFSSELDVKNVNVTSPLADLEFVWKSPTPKISYNVSIELFDGCLAADRLPRAPALVLESATDVRVSFDGKYTIFDAPAGPSGLLSAQMSTKSLAAFDVRPSKHQGAIDISQYPAEFHGPLIVSQSGTSLTFVAQTPLLSRRFDAESEYRIESQRKLKIKSGSRQYEFEFHAQDARANKNEAVKCRSLAAVANQEYNRKYVIEGVVASVRVTVSEIREDVGIDRQHRLRLQVNGEGAAIKFEGVPSPALAWIPGGHVTFFNFHGAATLFFDIDHKPVPLRVIDNVVIVGDFSARFDNEGRMVIGGRADAVWRNQTRLSLTKWERMDGGAAKFLGALLLTVLAALAGLVSLRLKNNKSFEWFRERRK